jgi:NTP pyrophosphatase (non-canonical NTP hydrolase)
MKDLLLKDERIIHMIRAEGLRQVAKWGIQRRSPFEWLCFLTEETGELSAAIGDYEFKRGADTKTIVAEAILVATLAAKIAEMYLNLDASLDE